MDEHGLTASDLPEIGSQETVSVIISGKSGNRQGLWAIDVNKNWRIVFEFKDGNAYVVDYEDYH